jgi:hypothetical protein
MSRILLRRPATGYAIADFVRAADRLNIELGSRVDYCQPLAPGRGLSPLTSVPFDHREISLPQVHVLPSLEVRYDKQALQQDRVTIGAERHVQPADSTDRRNKLVKLLCGCFIV